MKVLIIPDVHLKPFMFKQAAELMERGIAKRAVCLMDIPDDWNKQFDISLYEQTYDAAISFAFDDILDFHVKFERIHPFQDGNGRVGRIIMFKECLKYNIVPFIIEDNLKMYYYRGLKEWDNEKGYLRDTCLTAQDRYKQYLDYFEIKY